MEKVVAERNGIRPGDTVRIAIKLRHGMDRARVEVWASENGYPFSPYVDPDIARIREEGKPHFAAPYYRNIPSTKPKHIFTLTALDPMSVRLVQNVDTDADPSPKVRISVHGKAATPIRWFLGNAFRRIRSYANAAYVRVVGP